MTFDKALAILTEFNLWRNEEGKYAVLGALFPYTHVQLNEAIETACSALKAMSEQQQDNHEHKKTNYRIAYLCKYCGRVFNSPQPHICTRNEWRADNLKFDECSI